MNILVVGGAGFIGKHLIECLLEKKHRIVCVDNFSRGTRDSIRHLTGREDFALYDMDASNQQDLSTVFQNENIEYVFHLAANSDIQASACEPEIEYWNTYSTTFQLLSHMRTYGVKRLFFASSSAVYGDKRNVLLDEHTPDLFPVSYYGAAKLGSEAMIHAFSSMNAFCSLIFRFPNVIGPGLTHGVIYDFIKKLEHNPKYLQILGDGNQTKPYIYISDLIEAMMQMMEKVNSGTEIYNIGVTGDTTVTEIADILCEEMGLQEVSYEYTGGASGWIGDVPAFRYCLDKIHADGWSAKLTSRQAVEKTIQQELLLRRKEH